MKNLTNSLFAVAVLLLCSLFLTSCQAIGDIFSAGVYVGVFAVVIVVVIVGVIIAKMSNKN